VQLRSNNSGDILHFKYYDASEDAVLDIVETYDFVINDILGDVENPIEFNLAFVTLTFGNASSTGININYESNTAIAGFQFSVDGVDVTNVGGGEAENAGFMLTTGNNTIVGFSLSGATIPAGSGTLLSLEFEVSSEDQTLEVSNVIISGSDGSSISSSGPESIVITSPPEQFQFYQSTQQAFYYFRLVLINDIEVESNDWVGAFNGDVCVGARQWDISTCGSGICEVPVMGDGGSDATVGYMNPGEIPTFKIYDASADIYYDATPSEESPWFNFGQPLAELLSAIIPGCTDANYCNYDPSATIDDGSCDDSCLGCTDEDACNYNASATIDNGS